MIRHRSIGVVILTALMARDRMMCEDASVQQVDRSGANNTTPPWINQRPSIRRSQVGHPLPAGPQRQALAHGPSVTCDEVQSGHWE
ncbi:hypothetical protein E2C06_20195 [Dankookia rubra]|uniref:Uncharacterized protein n=1 Tax=Dankookia rubra TaxID=1442381 RepID=A0A4R5QCF6_9PROT|nr:hypothetical protein [Dankookia rubra]TDH60820.1 hypothetical protein E2C06_20195 [Dankookia rubra]